MKKVTVTSALREILKSMKIKPRTVFSDLRKVNGEKAVGVKFCGVKLSKQQIGTVRILMRNQGFTFHYANYNAAFFMGKPSYFNGTRLCFSK